MKKARKVLSLLLAAILVATLCSCGGGSSSTGSEKPAETAEAPAAENSQEADAAQEAEAAQAAEDTKTEETAQAEAAEETPKAEAAEETPAAETAIPEQPTQAEEIAEKYTVSDLPVEGEYNIFAVRYEGYTVSASEMEMRSTMSLKEGGTGTMTQAEDSIDITSWTSEDGVINITLADGSSAGGNARGVIIELDIYGTGDMLLIYAQEGADTSSYTLLTIEEVKEKMAAAEEASKTKLDAVVDGIDSVAGAHLRYQRRMDAIGAVQEIDVYARDGIYYSSKTTQAAGEEATVVTYIANGKAYNLYPEEMTGYYVTDVPLSITNADLLLMDDLYSEMRMAADRTDVTEEDREFEGTTYPAEIYPETEYRAETIFYFAEDGSLAYCTTATSPIELAAYIGESVFTVEVIDTAIDDSLFDISAYTIKE